MTSPASARWTVRPVEYEPRFAARVEPCACGGIVVVRGTDDDILVRAILAHNATPEHAAWRARRANRGEPAELVMGLV